MHIIFSLLVKMEPTLSYALLIIIPFLYLLLNRLARRFQNLPPIPPQCFPIIGHRHLMKKPQIYAQLADKYGPILMLYFGFRPILLISSPSMVEECLGKNDIIFADRPRFLTGKYLGYDYTTMVWASYGPHWRNLRKLATIEILSSSRIQMFSHVRAGEVHSLLRRLARAQKDEDGFSVAEMKLSFFELTLNIIMRMIAGKRYYGDDAQKTEEAKRFREIIKESNLVNVSTNLVDYIPFAKWFGGQIRMEMLLKRLQGKRDGFMQNLIEERRRTVAESEPENKDRTMIDILLTLQQNEPEYYTDRIIKGMVQTMLVGASETTAIAMEWTLALLLNHPKTLEKVHEEIKNHMGSSVRLIEDSDLSSFPYLQAVIDETLRLYPASDLTGHHEASADCVVGGYHISRGTILFLNTRVMQNNPEIWENPNEFRPERFLNVEKEKIKLEYMPFSLGRRRCPGEVSAKKVIGLALGSLIHCFEWVRMGEELLDMTEGPGLNVARLKPLNARCKIRPEMAEIFQS